MASPPKPRPQSAFQLTHPPSTADDGDLELRHQQNLRTKFTTVSKTSFDWLWQKSGILGNWMNKQAGKMGMEAFWPTSLDKECDKCARILYTFTQRGLNGAIHSTLEDPHANRMTQKVFKKIPTHVIQQAEGLAIFTVFRTGLGWSAASGSGIVIARDSPTTWGAPSGILVHTVGLGLLAGIDVYDAVLVLRTQKAVASFAKPKVSLGVELAVVAGPIGNGVSFESGPEVSPVFSYTKSKGIYGGLQLDGNIIIERTDENARFYGRKVKAQQILQGGAVAVPRAASGLIAVIDAAEGKAFEVDDLPMQVDVSPSEQSDGVSTLAESRAKAAAEVGIAEETDEESSTAEADDLRDRRRTLPPMFFHPAEPSPKARPGPVPSTSGPVSGPAEAPLVQTPELSQDPARTIEIDKSPEQSGTNEEDRPAERLRNLAPPPPPRRRVVPPPPPPLELPDDPLAPTTNGPDSALDSSISPFGPLSSNSSVSILDETHQKAPEPFKLHERSASDASAASNLSLS